MADEQGRTISFPAAPDVGRLGKVAANSFPAFVYGLRLWASVCLALYVAFFLQLDSPFWAGTSAALVCQPQLGASLRKGWFRLVGTVVGAIAIVILSAGLLQHRVQFLLGLALWGAACAFVATLIRNYGGYGAALAGYTAAIIASDQLGAFGGAQGDVFTLAVTRASEVCIGIVCAGIVLAGTDFGGARRRLAAQFADLVEHIVAGLAATLAPNAPAPADLQSMRRALVRRVIALDPAIDETLGESAHIRYHAPLLEKAVDGLFGALAGWRMVGNHLARLSRADRRQDADAILQMLPAALFSTGSEPGRWGLYPTEMRGLCEAAAHRITAFSAATPSLRMLADGTADALGGLSHALNGVALLISDQAGAVPTPGLPHMFVPDWLPAWVNAGRAFVTITVVALFWIFTAWPNGAEAVTFAAISVILFAPRADRAHAGAVAFLTGIGIAAVVAAVVKFAVLPDVQSFAGFCLVIGLWLVPAGAVAAIWKRGAITYTAVYFVPLLAPQNEMIYDTMQFYNAAVAILAGTAAAVLSFRLLPPLSPAYRIRRLQALTLLDLRRLARGRSYTDWTGRIHARLTAMPDEATPLQRAQLMAALPVGLEIAGLRLLALRADTGADFAKVLAAVADGDSAAAVAHLARVDAILAAEDAARETVRARARLLTLSEVLLAHTAYFDA